jgi:hypothetical protein
VMLQESSFASQTRRLIFSLEAIQPSHAVRTQVRSSGLNSQSPTASEYSGLSTFDCITGARIEEKECF